MRRYTRYTVVQGSDVADVAMPSTSNMARLMSHLSLNSAYFVDLELIKDRGVKAIV